MSGRRFSRRSQSNTLSRSGRYRADRFRKRLTKFLVVPLAAVVLATSLALVPPQTLSSLVPGLELEEASAHTVMHRVGRPGRVCREETQPNMVVVGYEGVGRLRKPIYEQQGFKRVTVCKWENIISVQARRHLHISEERCVIYGAAGAALAGVALKNPYVAIGGAVAAYEVCTNWDRVVFY